MKTFFKKNPLSLCIFPFQQTLPRLTSFFFVENHNRDSLAGTLNQTYLIHKMGLRILEDVNKIFIRFIVQIRK